MELVVILIQCALSIIKFILLDPYDEESYEGDIAYDLFYDRPKHLTREEKRFILAVFIIIAIGMFLSKLLFFVFNQVSNDLFINFDSDSLFLVHHIFVVSTYAILQECG